MQWPTKLGIADPFTPEEAATVWEFWPERRADFGPDVARDLEAAEPMLAVDSAITSQNRLEYRARMHESLVSDGIDLVVVAGAGVHAAARSG